MLQEFDLFDAGERLIVPDRLRGAIPVRETATVRFPGRIHISPIDCNRFGFGRAGGGGVGFAVTLDNTVEARVATETTVEGLRGQQAVLLHWTFLMLKMLQFDGGIHLSLKLCPQMDQHSGLGSSVAVAAACLTVINNLFGNPYTKTELRDALTSNFVEQCRGRVTRGLETGVGSHLILHGGFCAVGDDTLLLSSLHELDDYPVMLVCPKTSRHHNDDPECLEMLKRSLRLDESYRYTRAYRLVMDLLPALRRRDLETAGDVVWEFQFSGTHQSMLQGYEDGGVEIIRTMTFLKQSGAQVVGMSSVGPTIYALSEHMDCVVRAANNAGLLYTMTRVDPFGMPCDTSHANKGVSHE